MKNDTGFLGTLLNLPVNLWKSIFRNPLPSSDLGRSQTICGFRTS